MNHNEITGSIIDKVERPALYGRFRATPRKPDGGWLDVIGPDHPQHKEAERRFWETAKRKLAKKRK